MAVFNQDPPGQQTLSVSTASITLATGSTEGTVVTTYATFQQDGTGPTYFMNIELTDDGGGGVVTPTTGQIWPRGLS